MEKIASNYGDVEPFMDPGSITDTLPENMRLAEMSKFQHGFLCGLIKKYRPQKVLEVGVSAGGTSAIIMNCLQMLNLNSKFYSLDLNKTFPSKWNQKEMIEIGFVAEYVNEKLIYENYELILGDVLAAYIEEIGKNIDFLILDTTHELPGEVLDFLIALPFLKDGAIVVLHDVILNHYSSDYDAYATRILFDAVTGEKFYMPGYDSEDGLPNIAAFEINERTRNNIIDVISSLAYTWQYMPSKEQLQKYLDIIEKYYDEFTAGFMKRIVDVQARTLKNSPMQLEKIILRRILLKIKGNASGGVVLYGCGQIGGAWHNLLNENGIKVRAFVVSDNEEISQESINRFPVSIYHLKELPQEYKECLFIPAVWDGQIFDEMVEALQSNGYRKILFGSKDRV